MRYMEVGFLLPINTTHQMQKGKPGAARSKGFTLIEIVVVTVLVGVLSVAVVQMFFQVTKINRKTAYARTVDEAGRWILASMEKVVRSARFIEGMATYCQGEARNSLSFVDSDGYTAVYACDEGKIASTSAGTTVYLNDSTRAEITDCGSLFVCEQSGNSQTVSLRFTLRAGASSSSLPQDKYERTFRRKIVVKGY